jgi:hypothetical protein
LICHLQIVFRGFGFESDPAGGLIFLDDISYEANVLDEEGCPDNPFTLPSQPPPAAAAGAASSDSDSDPIPDNDLEFNSIITPKPGTFDNVSCTLLKCAFRLSGIII